MKHNKSVRFFFLNFPPFSKREKIPEAAQECSGCLEKTLSLIQFEPNGILYHLTHIQRWSKRRGTVTEQNDSTLSVPVENADDV